MLYLVSLHLVSPHCFAQNITNETTLFIPTGMEMRTDGNLTNAGSFENDGNFTLSGNLMNTGFFQNNGSFFLSGHWTNSSTYQGTGIVSLEGTDQAISNNNQSIEHLIINGGGVKSISGKLTITSLATVRSGMIDFNNGVVRVEQIGDTLLLGKDCIVNGGSADSYVDGPLVHTGSGYKFFPIGKNGKYHPVELQDVRGINPVVQMEVFESLPDIETIYPTSVRQDIYWQRKTISGRFESSPITLGYDLQGFNLSRLVILEGESFEDVFSVFDNVDINNSLDPNITGSVRPVSKNIFALGELLSDPPKEYYLSTTLSPNADNPDNRSVKVFGDNVTPVDFSFQVFNRWGLLIFESESFENMSTRGWDGVQNGNMLPSGAYPYSIKFVDTAGRATQQTGFITIIH